MTKSKVPFVNQAKAYLEGYKLMGKNAMKTKLPTMSQWLRFEKKMHEGWQQKKRDADRDFQRKMYRTKSEMNRAFRRAKSAPIPDKVLPFSPFDNITIMGAGCSLGTVLGISVNAGVGMFGALAARVVFRKLKYTAQHHPNDMFARWPLWPAKYEQQRVKFIQRVIIELTTDPGAVMYHHGYLDSPEAYYGETDFRKPKTEDQKESAKQGVGQVPPSIYFEQAMQTVWADERCKEIFGEGFGGNEPEHVLRRTGGEIDVMQMTWQVEGPEGKGTIQASVVRNLLDSVLIQPADRRKGFDFLIYPTDSNYTHLTHGANVHEDWDISRFY